MRGNGEIVLFILCERRFFVAKEPPLALSRKAVWGDTSKNGSPLIIFSFYSSRIICA